MDSIHAATHPSAHQPPDNQKCLPKAISDIAHFGSVHQQWQKTSAARSRLDATSLCHGFPG